MSVFDPYEVLGVHPRAPQEEVREAYRRKVKKHHPDVGGDAAAFRDVQAAWELVGDPVERSRFDAEFVRSRLVSAQAGYARSRPAPPPPAPDVVVEQSAPDAFRIPVWFWVLFVPLALVTVVYPPVQLLTVPLVVLLMLATFVWSASRRARPGRSR